jgi:hypothetical protein
MASSRILEAYSAILAATNHPAWTDYASAVGAILGTLTAAVALIIALRSAADARRSSASADQTRVAAEKIAAASQAALESTTQQLGIVQSEHDRLEAERARRPAVDRISASAIQPRPAELLPSGLFRIAFKNVGDRPLLDAILTILIDPGSVPALTDRWGTPTGQRPSDETRERWPGPAGLPRTFDYIAQNINVPIGVSHVQYVRVARWGRFALRIKLFQADMTESGPWLDSVVDVDRASGAALVDSLRAEFPGGVFEGRCAAFEVEPLD